MNIRASLSRALLLAALLPAVLPAGAHAQAQRRSPLGVEVWGGFAVPFGRMADESDVGFSVSADVVWDFERSLSLYGGYAYNRFSFVNTLGLEQEVRGWEAGVRYHTGVNMLVVFPFELFLSTGVTLYDSDALDPNGERFNTDEPRFGVQGGLGIVTDFRRKVSLSLAGHANYRPGGDVEGPDTCPPYDCPISYGTIRAALSFYP